MIKYSVFIRRKTGFSRIGRVFFQSTVHDRRAKGRTNKFRITKVTESKDGFSILDTVILIPAYKPTEALLKTLRSLFSSGCRLLVVDDGSGEAYADLFEKAGAYATVLHQNPNRGKGAALKYGIRYAEEEIPECRYLVTADADGQHTPADILKIVAELRKEGGFVIGARKMEGKVPLRSRFGNAITRFVFLVAAGKKCTDTQTGLRGFSRELFPLMREVRGERYEYEMNVLMHCAQEGVAMREVPISTVYENNNESSHFRAVRDSFRIYKTIFLNSMLVRYGLSAVFCFLLDFAALSLFERLISLRALPTLLARCISSPVNYLINRKLVFHSNAGKAASASGYAILVICMAFVKSGLITLLYDVLGMRLVLADILVEVLLFISNFIIQKLWIFRKKKGGQE